MSVDGVNSDSIRLYLLGELSEPERERVEERLMSDDDLYQQLLVAEDELIDEYVSDALPAAEQASFSRRFLQVPELRQDVRFAMALRQHARKTAPPVAAAAANSPARPRSSLLDWLRKIFMQPVVGVAFATLAVAALLLAGWLAAQNSQLRRQAGELQARQTPPAPAPSPDLQAQLDSARQRNEQLSAQLLQQQERLAQQEQLARQEQVTRQEQLAEESRKLQVAQQRAQPPPPARGQTPRSTVGAFVPLMLTAGAVRESGELKRITLAPGTPGAKIQLDPPAGVYRSYRVVLQTVEGERRLSKQGLRVGGRAQLVTFTVPANILEPNDYQVILTGTTPAGATEEIGSYYFRVLK